MEDVEMLVDVFYGYEDKLQKEEEAQDREELENINELGEGEGVDNLAAPDPKKIEKKPTNAGLESGTPRSEEETDPNALNLDPDHVVEALNAFEEYRK
jgi:hypothetical protein